MSSERPSILIVDDHPMIRSALKSIFDGAEWIDSIYEADNGKKALATLNSKRIDLVLLDINMPVMDGVACCNKIKQLAPSVKVVVLTQHDSSAYFKKFLKLGVDGYLLKGLSETEMLESIRLILLENEEVFSPQAARNLKLLKCTLSDREIEILTLLCEEKQTQEIAGLLNISPYTVNNHRISISRKTNTDNPIALTKWAIKNGLIEV
jgi:DNA-binding NarL/FixJ family response regulator